MRKAWLVLLMLAVPTALAAQQASPAPKPGHPLDPADVVTLSAKPQTASPYGAYAATPYVAYPTYGRGYGSSYYYDSWSTETSPPFTPLVFGRIGDRPVVLFTTTNRDVPPLFYGHGQRFLFAPARPALFGGFGTFGR
ncbi:MAG TPA: hypothetical protein VLB32_02055 [Candidatus Acidoferrales bacterium]|nr:hypothetical protein [Candidatus Acidoferrales bacterium]